MEADPSSDWEAQLAVGEGELLVEEDQHRPHEAPWLQELMKEKLIRLNVGFDSNMP